MPFLSTPGGLVRGPMGAPAHGRKYADAAFLFALAGTTNTRLLDTLASGTLAELERSPRTPALAVALAVWHANPLVRVALVVG